MLKVVVDAYGKGEISAEEKTKRKMEILNSTKVFAEAEEKSKPSVTVPHRKSSIGVEYSMRKNEK